MQKLVAVSGVKNSGKTAFLEKLIPALGELGLRAAVIKHDGHSFLPDREGTDTFRLLSAGAAGAAFPGSPSGWMMMVRSSSSSGILSALFSSMMRTCNFHVSSSVSGHSATVGPFFPAPLPDNRTAADLI